MSNIVLDYAIKFSQVTGIGAPSLGFLKDIGICVIDPEAPVPSTGTMLVGTRDGDLVIPATIELLGGFLKGDTFSLEGVRDVEGIMGAEYAISEDMNAFQVATVFGAYIAGNTGIAVSVVDTSVGALSSADIEIVAVAPNATFHINGVGLLRAPPAGNIIEVTEQSDLALVVPHLESQINACFDNGLNKVFIVKVQTPQDLEVVLRDRESDFYTLACSTDFTIDEWLFETKGWQGVRLISSIVRSECSDNANLRNVCAFYYDETVMSYYNAYYAFGGFLSSTGWRNQQYSPLNSSVGAIDSLGLAESLFNDRVSFYMHDDETGTVLGFFVAGGQSITTPYISKELEIVMQGDMTNFLATNQPFNVAVERAELERIGLKVIQQYIDLGYLNPDGVNEIRVVDGVETFTVIGTMTTTVAIALWRAFIESYQVEG